MYSDAPRAIPATTAGWDYADMEKSLQDLDGHDWGESSDGTFLVRECHRLRRVPLRDLSVENLRLLLGQGIGYDYLLPVALHQLAADPLAEGDYYPGDLLLATLKAPPAIWQRHPQWRSQAVACAQHALTLIGGGPLALGDHVSGRLQEGVEQFMRKIADNVSPE